VATGCIFLAAAGLLWAAAGMAFCQLTLHVRRVAATHVPQIRAANCLLAGCNHSHKRQRLPTRLVCGCWKCKKCVVVLHGIADSRAGSAGFAPFFLQHGYSVLLPDSRAHGQSGGQFVTYGLLEKYDVLEWANWLQKAGCTELYALGESLGASIVIQAAALKPVFRAIVAECAYADLRKIAAYRVEQMLPFPLAINRCFSTLVVASGITYARLRYGFDFNEVSPVASIRRTVTPVLLIHGLKDTRTPPGHSQALLAANPQMVLWLVPDSGHTNASATHPQEFQDRVLGWFGQHK
jgi:uncharacterized protein